MVWNSNAQSFDYERNSLPPGNDGLWYSRGYIPHFDAPEGVIQSITVHLDDALPLSVIQEMQAELGLTTEWRKQCVDAETENELRHREIKLRWMCHRYLDTGHGSCALAIPDCAAAVEESLLWGDSQRYRLIAWCIMPNHLHVLLEPVSEYVLSDAIGQMKRHTTRQMKEVIRRSAAISCAESVDWSKARKLVARGVRVWQRDCWDRFIRDHGHFDKAVAYIEDNPVRAGLVEATTDWPWSSARHKAS